MPFAMRLARLLAVCTGLAMLSSCSMSLTVRLGNATSQEISVMQEFRELASTVIEPGKNRELRALTYGVFTVTRAGKTHWYRLHQAPDTSAEGFVRMEGWGFFSQRILVATYAEDGCIYLVPFKHDSAVALRDVQPKGFPVCAGNEDIKPGGIRRQ